MFGVHNFILISSLVFVLRIRSCIFPLWLRTSEKWLHACSFALCPLWLRTSEKWLHACSFALYALRNENDGKQPFVPWRSVYTRVRVRKEDGGVPSSWNTGAEPYDYVVRDANVAVHTMYCALRFHRMFPKAVAYNRSFVTFAGYTLIQLR